MKKLLFGVIFIIIVCVGFYFGYDKATSSSGNSPVPQNLSAIPANAISKDTTLTVDLDKVETVIDDDGMGRQIQMSVRQLGTGTDPHGTVKPTLQMSTKLLTKDTPPKIMSMGNIVSFDKSSFSLSMSRVNSPLIDPSINHNFSLHGTATLTTDNKSILHIQSSVW